MAADGGFVHKANTVYVILLDISVEHADFNVLSGGEAGVHPQHIHVGQAASVHTFRIHC